MPLATRPSPTRPPARPAPVRVMPTFLYGIGAPRSGTTWLYEYLRRHPDCHLRGHKELHYFDAIERGEAAGRARQLAAWIAEREALFGSVPPAERRQRLAEIMDMRDFRTVLQICRQDPGAYFRYLLAGMKDQKVVADITPNYGLLSSEMLGKMAATAERTRFVYLMRDPVDRLWSQLRMRAEQTLPPGADFAAQVAGLVDELLAGGLESLRRHSDYAAVIGRLDAAVPPGNALILFHEDLTTPDGVRDLCRFLKIRPMAADFAARVLEGRDLLPTEEQRAALRRLLAPQYAFVARRFPVLPAAWTATMAEGLT